MDPQPGGQQHHLRRHPDGRSHQDAPRTRRRCGERAFRQLDHGECRARHQHFVFLCDGSRKQIYTPGRTRHRADVHLSQYRDQPHDDEQLAAGHRYRRNSGDADRWLAHQRYRGLGENGDEGFQHQGHGDAQRAAQRQDGTGLPDSRFIRFGTGQRVLAQTAGGGSGSTAGSLLRRDRAVQPGVRRNGHIPLRGSPRTEQHRAPRELARRSAKACRGVGENLSHVARVGNRTQLDGEQVMASRILQRLMVLVLAGVPCSAAAANFNILDYGARNDGSAPATEAFRKAIQAAKAAGGGTVYVPAGKYVTGPIELVSNLVLYFDAGAVVQFPAQRLPFTKGRQQSIEALTPVPLIGGSNLENVTIAGRGLLMSNNDDWMRLMPRQKGSASHPGSANGPNWEKLLLAPEVT